MIRGRLDRCQVLPLVLGEGRLQGQLGHAEDGIHGGSDLVADVGEELVLGSVRRFSGLFGEAQFFLGPLLAGHVQVQALDKA